MNKKAAFEAGVTAAMEKIAFLGAAIGAAGADKGRGYEGAGRGLIAGDIVGTGAGFLSGAGLARLAKAKPLSAALMRTGGSIAGQIAGGVYAANKASKKGKK